MAKAAIIGPGGTAPLPGTTVAAESQLAGLVVQDQIINLGSGLTLQDRVVKSNVDDTFDFYWRIINPSNARVSVNLSEAFRNGFAGFTTNVNWRIDGLGSIAPESANRSPGGNVVAFDFDSPFLLSPGESTRFFFIDTNALAYDRNGVGNLINITEESFQTFRPTAVPTPALLPGLIGMGLTALRKRQQMKAVVG